MNAGRSDAADGDADDGSGTGARGRGGGWVLAQFVLLALVPVAAFLPPPWPRGARGILLVVGLGLILAGAAIVVWAARTLGRSMTPFPRPLPGTTLVEAGPYAHVRHPVYAGALVLLVGVSLATSVAVLLVTGALGLLWAGKARVEEEHLLRAVPGYDGYRERVQRRLVPGLY